MTLVDLLGRAERILVFTGAGISTYRAYGPPSCVRGPAAAASPISAAPAACGPAASLSSSTNSSPPRLNGSSPGSTRPKALALGSTLSVHPAASIPLEPLRRGVINRGATDHDHICTLGLDGDVGQILPPAVERVIGATRG